MKTIPENYKKNSEGLLWKRNDCRIAVHTCTSAPPAAKEWVNCRNCISVILWEKVDNCTRLQAGDRNKLPMSSWVKEVQVRKLMGPVVRRGTQLYVDYHGSQLQPIDWGWLSERLDPEDGAQGLSWGLDPRMLEEVRERLRCNQRSVGDRRSWCSHHQRVGVIWAFEISNFLNQWNYL